MMLAELPRARRMIRRPMRGAPLRRFTEHAELNPEAVIGLAETHPAIVNATTKFPKTIVDPRHSPRVLVDGINQRKLGNRVTKGEWAGMRIFALTLVERATCPPTCPVWLICYGNTMPFSRRHLPGVELERRLERELATKQTKHRHGFVVRLHLLGDFYSRDYVDFWARALQRFPSLRVFGYSAWPEGTEIGDAVAALRDERWDRFAVRTSSDEPGPARAVTMGRMPTSPRVAEGLVCPAALNRTACCGTCGLCWSPWLKHETIVFPQHGLIGRQKAAA